MKLVRLPLIWTEYEKLDENQTIEYSVLGKEPEAVSEEGSIVVDIDEIVSWFKDKENTVIDLRNGKRYQVSLKEEEFCQLFIELTKHIITEVQVQEENEENEENGIN